MVEKEQFSKSLKRRDCVIGELYLESQLYLLVVLGQLVNLPRFHFIYGKMKIMTTLWTGYEDWISCYM